MTKRYKKGIPNQTASRFQAKLGRVFVYVGGRKDVSSEWGKQYPMTVKDDYSRKTWLYVLRRSKSYSVLTLNRFLTDWRADRFPSIVKRVRFDNGRITLGVCSD